MEKLQVAEIYNNLASLCPVKEFWYEAAIECNDGNTEDLTLYE